MVSVWDSCRFRSFRAGVSRIEHFGGLGNICAVGFKRFWEAAHLPSCSGSLTQAATQGPATIRREFVQYPACTVAQSLHTRLCCPSPSGSEPRARLLGNRGWAVGRGFLVMLQLGDGDCRCHKKNSARSRRLGPGGRLAVSGHPSPFGETPRRVGDPAKNGLVRWPQMHNCVSLSLAPNEGSSQISTTALPLANLRPQATDISSRHLNIGRHRFRRVLILGGNMFRNARKTIPAARLAVLW
ncbi:uncharacterized protein B0T15DRAFT_193916 [Chaetomium strumarium]|uniref:Uncharacterized protein n=1 Tax=Chaetomium strumarium TaxID=1170767 RepID=A0AAJ0M1A2_9PEZI|nr:hypothetical protein B0T15DRAFT_193916 [Chaetomium strumarium]